MQLRSRTSVKVFASLVVVLLTIVPYLQGQESGGSESVLVQSAMVKPGEAISIVAEQSGILTAINVREGSHVSTGDLVASIDDASNRQRLEKVRLDHELAKKLAQNRVDLEYASKSYDVALAELNRSIEANLRVANSVPVSKVEKQKLESERARLMLQKAAYDIEVAAFKTRLTSAEIQSVQLDLSKAKVQSKTNGLVVAIDKHVGEWVQPGDVVCRLVRTDRLRVEGFVTADQASRIAVGSQARVEFAYPWMKQKVIQGSVVFVSPDANPVNLNVQVWVEIPNDELKIPTGVRGTIAISPSPTSLIR